MQTGKQLLQAEAASRGNQNKPPFFPRHMVQPKLQVNEPGDQYEYEADAMADRVMRMTGNSINYNAFFKPAANSVQRKCQHCEEEEKLHRKESLGEEVEGSNELDSYVGSLGSSGQGLSNSSRQFFESRFGHDFSNVRIHNDSVAAKSAQSINALAYTSGNNIVFNSGQYSPESESGKRLMAHELTHVVQQQGSGVSRKIMRQVANKDNEVTFAENGKTYRITRTVTPENTTEQKPEGPHAKFDMDETNVYLDVTWCRGNIQGKIEFGANVPEKVKDLFTQILQQAQSGSSPDDIKKTIINSDITPYISVDIAKSGGWEISGDVHVTVDKSGATGGSGGISFGKGPIKGGVQVQVPPGGGARDINVGPTLTWTPGQTDKEFTCPTHDHIRVTYKKAYKCEQWQEKEVDKTRQVTVTDSDSRYIYFVYANEKIDEARSKDELAQIEQRLREGYHVQSIHGFTSPEGPMDKQNKGFRGNDQLSQDRADAALARVQKIVADINADGSKISGVSPDVIPLGNSELYTETSVGADGKVKEVEGKPLEQHAEQEFDTHTDEDRHRAGATEQLAHAHTYKQRADIIYPLLRRAVIVFKRDRQEQQPYKEKVSGYETIDCATMPHYADKVTDFNVQDSLRSK